SDTRKGFLSSEPHRRLHKNLYTLTDHWYYMRAVPAGYIYIFDSAKDQWLTAFLVDSSGLLREMPIADLPAAPGGVVPLDQPGVCMRDEHNPTALQYFVLDPVKNPKVQVAFSRYRWSQDVLDAYQVNEGNIRGRRMWEMDVVAAAKNDVGVGNTVPQARTMTASLGNHVADYASYSTRDLINDRQLEPLHNRGGGRVLNTLQTPYLIDAEVSGARLAAEMAQSSKATEGKNGIILYMEDVVGVAMQMNHYRNRATAEIADVTGMGDEDRSRKRIIAELIEGVRLNAEKNPGPWYARHYGPERYLRHIDENAWRAALDEKRKADGLIEYGEKASADYCAVINSDAWKLQQRCDFSDGVQAGLDHEDMVACCVAGSGQTGKELREVWEPVLELPADDPDNWLERSLGALHLPFISYLGENPGDQDEAYDAAHEATNLLGEYSAKALVKLDGFRSAIRVQRAANLSTATIIETSAGLLFKLRQNNPKAYRKLLRKVTIALITRDDIAVQPSLFKGTWQEISQKFMAVVAGDPRVRAQVPVGVARGSTVGMSPITKPGLSGAVDGALVLVPPNTQEEAASAVAWVVKKLESGGRLDHELLRKLQLTQINISAQSAANPTLNNPLLDNHLQKIGAHASVVLGAGAMFFQFAAGASVIDDYRKKHDPGAEDKLDLTIGLTYSVIGSLSAGMDLYVAVQTVRGIQSVSVKLVAKWAARGGAFAGVIEGTYSIYQGVQKGRSGDLDSGLWSMGSGAALVTASIAGLGGFSAAAAGATGLTAATGATGLAALMGPVGWALIVVAALGLALYCAWQAFATDDSEILPIEYWLDNGVFGKRAHRKDEKNVYLKNGVVSPFDTIEDEIREFQRVVFAAMGRFSDFKDRHGISYHFNYQVDLPRYAEGSRLELHFTAVKDGKRMKKGQAGTIVCEDGKQRLSIGRIGRRNLHAEGYERAQIKVDPITGAMNLSGTFALLRDEPWAESLIEWITGEEINPDEMYVDDLEMEGAYWPDKTNMPDVVSTFRYPERR
ncbi:toxin VasX, partial [Luteimonas lutimaris]|uniref:toxin VasX n=1 Tax=Luteimonas lutimaris TaxID=698645 RepID=UPI0031D5293C